MSRRRRFSPVEIIKSFLIFLLMVLMLVLLILLLLSQSGTREEALPEADRMVVYASGVQPMDTVGMETSRVTPYLLACRHAGNALSVVHASDADRKSYEVLYPLIREQLGTDTVGYPVDASVCASVISACAASEELIYLCYNGALPSCVIRAYTFSEEDSIGGDSEDDGSVSGNAAYIKELFFVPASSLQAVSDALPTALPADPDAVCTLSRDDRGAVMMIAAPDARPMTAAAEMPDDGALAGYTASLEALSADAQTGVFAEHITAHPAIRLDGLYRMPQITRRTFDPAASLYGDDRTLSAVLRMLGMRESDTDNYYTAGTGDRVYLNANGRLTFSGTDSSVRYDALQEGGLDLAEYLGYSSIDGNYRLSEYLRAADRLLSGLEALEGAFGGDGLRCTLVDVTVTDTDELSLTYAYTHRGIPLTDTDGSWLLAMVLRAGGGVISHLELYPCHAEIAEEERYLLPQSVTLDALYTEHPDDVLPDGLYMLYRPVLNRQGETVFSADWIGLAE